MAAEQHRDATTDLGIVAQAQRDLHERTPLPSDLDDILTSEQVCIWLKIKDANLRVMRSRGQIPYLRLVGSGAVRYSRAALEDWLRTRAVAVAVAK